MFYFIYKIKPLLDPEPIKENIVNPDLITNIISDDTPTLHPIVNKIKKRKMKVIHRVEPVTEKSNLIKEKINNYIENKKMLPYDKNNILLMLKKKTIVNYWQNQNNKYYGLNKTDCDNILKILMPVPPVKIISLDKIKKKLSDMGSNYIKLYLNNSLVNEKIKMILHGTKTYSLTKINLNRVSLQSSFNFYLGEYFIHNIMSMYTENNKLDKTNFIKMLEDFKLNKKSFKTLDYFLIIYLTKYFKKLSALNSKDKSIKKKRIKFKLNDADIEKIEILINETNKDIQKLNSNRVINLGKILINLLFTENIDYYIYENVYDFILSKYTIVPLLYMEQEYPFDIDFNRDNDSLGKSYSGSYIFNEKETSQNIHSKSAYYFKNKHVKIIENIYINRYLNKDSSFLFINYFYNIDLNDLKLQNLIQITNFDIKEQDLLDYILDVDIHRMPIIEQFIQFFKTKEGKTILTMSSPTEQEKVKVLFNFYEEINTKKYMLRTTLENILVFDSFGFFVPVSIPKYTGREFTIFTPLDITLKLVRCITNVHSTITGYTEKKSYYNLVLDDQYDELSNYFSTMARNDMLKYKKRNKKNIYKHVDELVGHNKKIIKENLREFNPINLNRLVTNYKIDIYKAVRYLIAKESIFLHEEFTIEKDACNSGLQILSLIFKSISGAKLCGLLNPHYIQKGEVTDLYEYVKNLFIEDIIPIVEDSQNREELLKKGEYNEEAYVNDNNLQWLHNYKRKNSFRDLIDNFVVFLRHNIQILLDRSLWKSLTMPQQYGMTNYSMKQVLMAKLRDNNTTPYTIKLLSPYCDLIVYWYEKRAKPKLPLITDYLNTQMDIHKNIVKNMSEKNDLIKKENKNIKIYNKTIKEYNKIINLKNEVNKKKIYEENKDMESEVFENTIFLPNSYKDYLLKENILELEIPIKDEIKYIKKIEPIVFKSNTYKWEYQVFKLTSHKIKLGRQQMKFYRPKNEHDVNQMFRSLPPIFIHGLDANIVHNIKRTVARHGYSVVTIHDCFLVSSNYLTVMLEDLEVIYNNLYDSNYFEAFLIQNNFDPKYLKNIRDKNHPDYLDFKTMCTQHFGFVK
jgi:hypothetical protein